MQIVKEGKTKEGIDFILRYPEASDVQSVWEYINKLSKERTFIRFQGEDVSMEQEEKFVADDIKMISEHKSVSLFLVVDKHVKGICGIHLSDKTEGHTATLGLSVDESVRGQGLGKLLMETTIQEAIGNLDELKIITLKVKAPNTNAIALYKKLGFKEYSRLPLGTRHRENLVDEIGMYMNIER